MNKPMSALIASTVLAILLPATGRATAPPLPEPPVPVSGDDPETLAVQSAFDHLDHDDRIEVCDSVYGEDSTWALAVLSPSPGIESVCVAAYWAKPDEVVPEPYNDDQDAVVIFEVTPDGFDAAASDAGFVVEIAACAEPIDFWPAICFAIVEGEPEVFAWNVSDGTVTVGLPSR